MSEEIAQPAADAGTKQNRWAAAVVEAAKMNGWFVDGAPIVPYPKKDTVEYVETMKAFKRRLIADEADLSRKMWMQACFEASEGEALGCRKTDSLYPKAKKILERLQAKREETVEAVLAQRKPMPVRSRAHGEDEDVAHGTPSPPAMAHVSVDDDNESADTPLMRQEETTVDFSPARNPRTTQPRTQGDRRSMLLMRSTSYQPYPTGGSLRRTTSAANAPPSSATASKPLRGRRPARGGALQ